jgi:hypothetical protein
MIVTSKIRIVHIFLVPVHVVDMDPTYVIILNQDLSAYRML